MIAGGITIEDVFNYLSTGGILGLLALAIGLYVDRRRLQVAAKANDRKADLDLEVHRDGLTFQLLETARAELAILRVEVERLRPNEEHLHHFEMALQHIEALLLAESEAERMAAERGAKAFLNRMRRMQEARGTILNEAQRQESEVALSERRKRRLRP